MRVQDRSKWTVRVTIAACLVGLCWFAGCVSDGAAKDTVTTKLIESASRGFFDKLWDFTQQVIFPTVIGFVAFFLSGGGSIGALVASGSAAGTSLVLRPDAPPTTLHKTDIHVAPGGTVNVETALQTDPSKWSAISEGLMSTIEHWGFYLLLVAFAFRNRRHVLDMLSGRAKGRIGRTLWHCLFGGNDPSTTVQVPVPIKAPAQWETFKAETPTAEPVVAIKARRSRPAPKRPAPRKRMNSR